MSFIRIFEFLGDVNLEKSGFCRARVTNVWTLETPNLKINKWLLLKLVSCFKFFDAIGIVCENGNLVNEIYVEIKNSRSKSA